MKSPSIMFALTALGLFACSSAVPATESETAQQQSAETAGSAKPGAPPSPADRRGPPSPEALMQKFDKDKNGALAGDEIPQRMQRADGNHDGQITLAELKAHVAEMRDKHSEHAGKHRSPPSPETLAKELDTDGNGKIEGAEIPDRLEEADTNNDNTLSIEELKAHREQMQAAHFARMDTNKDGALTKEEVGERWRLLSTADANSDGKVTRAELDAAHASGKLRPMGPRHGSHADGADDCEPPPPPENGQ